MYTQIFLITCVVVAVIWYFTQHHQTTAKISSKDSAASSEPLKTPEFLHFQRVWLAVYLLAMFSDWLQGPYAYALYNSLNFTPSQIAQLSVTGFGSSMIVGTFVGSLSDSFGRKKMTLLFCILYSISALTKLSTSFWTLLVGRMMSGVATSLLFCVFEAWMVCEHNKRKFPPSLISDTFSKATAGNGFCAVIAGLLATQLADRWGYASPFVFSIVPLVLLAGIVAVQWEENTGHDSQSKSTEETPTSLVQQVLDIFQTQPHIFALGLGQSLFEGAMFTFVFLWSPCLAKVSTYALTAEGASLPYGTIFANFMVSISCGSYFFGWIAKTYSPEISPLVIHSIAALSMVLSAVLSDSNEYLLLFFFLLFEMTCGMFWPTYGTLRSIHIPEAQRATISTVFRIPLNLFVICLLLRSDKLNSSTMFVICAIAHFTSLLCFGTFKYMNNKYQTKVKKD